MSYFPGRGSGGFRPRGRGTIQNFGFGILPLMRPTFNNTSNRGSGYFRGNQRGSIRGGRGQPPRHQVTPGRGEIIRLGPSKPVEKKADKKDVKEQIAVAEVKSENKDVKIDEKKEIKDDTPKIEEKKVDNDVKKVNNKIKKVNDEIKKTTAKDEKKKEEIKTPLKTEPIKKENESIVKVQTVKKEVKPAPKMMLDKHNSELHMKIENDGLTAQNMRGDEGFNYMWAGVRASHGVTSGKVCFEVHLIEHLKVNMPGENAPHVARIGWSVDMSDYQVGEDKLSWGYGGTGKSVYDNKFLEYGKRFKAGDTVACYVDLDASPKAIFYMLNGAYLGVAFRFTDELEKKPIFPHVCSKNMKFKINFGSSPPRFPLTVGFNMIQSLPADKVLPPSPSPRSAKEAEIIMMVGLPGSGKSYWCEQYAKDHLEKKFYILGTNNIIDRMKVSGLAKKRNYHGRWEELIKRASSVLNKLFNVAKSQPRNYVLDQTNVYFSARRRKMDSFSGYRKVAVVVVNTPEVLAQRTEKQKKAEGKDIPIGAIMEMKANFSLPEVGPSFNEVRYIEEQLPRAQELVGKYRAEGEAFKNPSKRKLDPPASSNTLFEKKPKVEIPAINRGFGSAKDELSRASTTRSIPGEQKSTPSLHDQSRGGRVDVNRRDSRRDISFSKRDYSSPRRSDQSPLRSNIEQSRRENSLSKRSDSSKRDETRRDDRRDDGRRDNNRRDDKRDDRRDSLTRRNDLPRRDAPQRIDEPPRRDHPERRDEPLYRDDFPKRDEYSRRGEPQTLLPLQRDLTPRRDEFARKEDFPRRDDLPSRDYSAERRSGTTDFLSRSNDPCRPSEGAIRGSYRGRGRSNQYERSSARDAPQDRKYPNDRRDDSSRDYTRRSLPQETFPTPGHIKNEESRSEFNDSFRDSARGRDSYRGSSLRGRGNFREGFRDREESRTFQRGREEFRSDTVSPARHEGEFRGRQDLRPPPFNASGTTSVRNDPNIISGDSQTIQAASGKSSVDTARSVPVKDDRYHRDLSRSAERPYSAAASEARRFSVGNVPPNSNVPPHELRFDDRRAPPQPLIDQNRLVGNTKFVEPVRQQLPLPPPPTFPVINRSVGYGKQPVQQDIKPLINESFRNQPLDNNKSYFDRPTIPVKSEDEQSQPPIVGEQTPFQRSQGVGRYNERDAYRQDGDYHPPKSSYPQDRAASQYAPRDSSYHQPPYMQNQHPPRDHQQQFEEYRKDDTRRRTGEEYYPNHDNVMPPQNDASSERYDNRREDPRDCMQQDEDDNNKQYNYISSSHQLNDRMSTSSHIPQMTTSTANYIPQPSFNTPARQTYPPNDIYGNMQPQQEMYNSPQTRQSHDSYPPPPPQQPYGSQQPPAQHPYSSHQPAERTAPYVKPPIQQDANSSYPSREPYHNNYAADRQRDYPVDTYNARVDMPPLKPHENQPYALNEPFANEPIKPDQVSVNDPTYEKQQEDYQKAYSQWYANYAQAFAELTQQQPK